MRNIGLALVGILMLSPTLAQADTIYHFDLMNQTGTAVPGQNDGFAGSFVTYLDPASGDQGHASALAAHRWTIDASTAGAPGQTPHSGVDVRVDDAANLSVRIFGFDVLAQFLSPLSSVHGQNGNFDFDLTVKNAGNSSLDLSNPVSGYIFAQVGDPANANSGYIFPRFLNAPDANPDGTIDQSSAIYPPIQELGLAATTSLFLGFVPGDPNLRLLAGFSGLDGFTADGVGFHTGFDISASLRPTGFETTGSAVPEPVTCTLLSLGVGGALLRRRTAG